MTVRIAGLAAVVTGIVLAYAAPVGAMTMQECSAKYKAAQSAGTLGGLKWNDFRKQQCGDGTAAAAPAAKEAPKTTSEPAKPAEKAAAPAAAGNAVFPKAISAKYASETPSKQRMHTCLDQYNANKAANGNGNGGLKWIEKGGGYWSQCNAKLKG